LLQQKPADDRPGGHSQGKHRSPDPDRQCPLCRDLEHVADKCLINVAPATPRTARENISIRPIRLPMESIVIRMPARSADAGLSETGRCRTPGLHTEEVAALAGVGLTWHTWFE
jgi:hypothetical protein